MKSISKGSVSSAWRAIRNNRARSIMTMLGIVIGVFSAVLVVGVGLGLENQVQGQISRLGKDLITVRPGVEHQANVFDALGSAAPGKVLSDRDVRAAGSAHGVAAVTPLALVDGSVDVPKGGDFTGNVIATTSDFAKTLHQEIEFGAFFRADDSDAQMAVIGSDVSAGLFKESVPLGRGFSFRGQDFIVVGVLKQFESSPLLGEADLNNAIFIPYKTAQTMASNSAPVYEMLVRPKSSHDINVAAASVHQKLLNVHGGEESFSVLKQGQSLQVTNGIISLMSKLVLAAAAIALFVGGIGIMNIMLVSVTERMREIGIRKAVGATNRQIMGQFLTEALLLSVGGWMIGVLLAIVGVYMIRLLTTIEAIVPWAMVAISFVVTMVAGVIFGSIPALKAALKDPIDALRNE